MLQLVLPALGLSPGAALRTMHKPPTAALLPRANACMRSDEPGLKTQLGAAALAVLFATAPVTPFLGVAFAAPISATSDPGLSQEAARLIVAKSTKSGAAAKAAVPLPPPPPPPAVEAPAAAAAPAAPAPAKKAPAKGSAPAKKAPAKGGAPLARLANKDRPAPTPRPPPAPRPPPPPKAVHLDRGVHLEIRLLSGCFYVTNSYRK